MPAVVFDLDETLLDTSMLRADREHGRWRQLATRLDEARPYAHMESSLQAASLPVRATTMGFQIGILTHSPRWYAERLLDEFGIRCDALVTGSRPFRPNPTRPTIASPLFEPPSLPRPEAIDRGEVLRQLFDDPDYSISAQRIVQGGRSGVSPRPR